MAWLKPDKDSSNNAGQHKNSGPPDIEKAIGDFLKKIRSSIVPSKNSNSSSPNRPSSKLGDHKLGMGVVVGVVIAAWFLSGFYIINPAEQGVVLQLGQYDETVGPGLHWIPRFIDSKSSVDVQKINSFALQGDFLTKSADQNDLENQYVADLQKPDDKLSDKSKNLVNVEMTVQYRVSDPRAYLYNVVDADNTIQQVASGALSEVIGKMKLDDVLTTGRELLSSGVLQRTKEVLTSYNAGLEVVAVTLRKVQAPDQVQAAFNDVNRADQDKATYIQQAQAYASKVVPLAQGDAARILADAVGYKQQVVLGSQAQVAKFNAISAVYKISPEITRERLYLETFQKIFENTTKVLVDGNGNNILNLPIDKLLTMPKSSTDQSDETDKNLSPGIISASSNADNATDDSANNSEAKA